MYFIFSKLFAFITAIMVLITGALPTVPADLNKDNYPAFKDVYADYFDIGTKIRSADLDDPEYVEFILKNYSSLTPEWEFKLPAIHPSENEWHFEGMDKIADFAREHNLKLRAHCLLWGALDNWMLYDENGNFVDKEVYYARQYEYFNIVMHRYEDIVSVWDVTNEVLGYSTPTGELKTHYAVYQLCGPEYVEVAFRQAREILPDAKLCFNECGLAKNYEKQIFLKKWLTYWVNKGVPIDVFGVEGHCNAISENETVYRLEGVLKIIEGCGIKEIQITEMDMDCYYDKETNKRDLEQWRRDYQTVKYRAVFELLREHSDYITSVSFWGSDDAHRYGEIDKGEAMMFDYNLLPKACYFAIIDF